MNRRKRNASAVWGPAVAVVLLTVVAKCSLGGGAVDPSDAARSPAGGPDHRVSSSASPAGPVEYNVTSVRVAAEDVENACVTLDVKVKNFHSEPAGGVLGVDGDEGWLNPFTFTYKRSRLWNAVSTISFDSDNAIPAGGTRNGEIRTCFEDVEPFHSVKPGDRLTVHLGKKHWQIKLPKPKPKPKPEPNPARDSGDGDSEADDSSGGGSGYNGPRCYAPGGKTWRPC